MGVLVIGACCAALSACGGSSNDAQTLLKQTFSGPHKVSSGKLNLVLTLDPGGSTTLKNPITLTFGGPFQSLGTSKIPQSNFNVSLSSGSSGGAVGILSTGTAGYVTFQGQSYQLPQSAFQKLESSFSGIASSPGSSGNSSVLSKLGIQPLHWLQNPTVVGNETVGGSNTTHIRAQINVAALLADLNTFLSKASSLGVSGASSFPHGISSASQQRIAASVRNPRFDVWTGTNDKTVRRLQVSLTLPVTGQISTLLGGLRTADIGLSMEYADLNQPQSITAPTSVRPYSEFQSKLRAFEQQVQSTISNQLGGAGGSGSLGSTGSGAPSGSSTSPSGSGGSTTPSGSGTPSSQKIQAYSQCIQSAGSDIAKMQQCAPLLNGG